MSIKKSFYKKALNTSQRQALTILTEKIKTNGP